MDDGSKDEKEIRVPGIDDGSRKGSIYNSALDAVQNTSTDTDHKTKKWVGKKKNTPTNSKKDLLVGQSDKSIGGKNSMNRLQSFAGSDDGSQVSVSRTSP